MNILRWLSVVIVSILVFNLCATYPHAQSRTVIEVRQITTYGCARKRLSGENPADSAIQISNSTGSKVTDDAVSVDITELDKQFQVYVPVYFELSDAKNAFFTTDKYPDLILADKGTLDQPYDGSVVLGMGLWNDETVKNAGFALPALIAHEFAHAMQHKRRFPRVGGKWAELHADFLAGWFTGHRGRHTFQNDALILKSFFDKGDFEFFSEDHHGTPQERANAFYHGYLLNRQSGVAFGTHAYEYGIQYLNTCRQNRLCL
jgi:hypothetical protein